MTDSRALPEAAGQQSPPRICLVYDCRWPVSHGGAEKWLGSLGKALAEQGTLVTYLHGAKRGEDSQDGVRWVGLTASGEIYRASGVRRVLPAVRFSYRVARYLRLHAHDFDLVYVHDMPILSVLGAWWALRPTRTPWAVEWIEWWGARYWRSYAGPLIGTVGYLAQRLALAVTPLALCFSALTAQALSDARPKLSIARLAGQAAPIDAGPPDEADGAGLAPPQPTTAVFLGRFVRHKRPHLAVDAALQARATIPDLRLVLIGHGPEEASLQERAAALGDAVLTVRVGAGESEVRDVLRRASVLVHPSAREGFGLAVAEANCLGVPVVLVAGPDNAAPELIQSGGGITVAHADPQEIADAIVATLRAGDEARRDALANGRRLGEERSVARSCRQLLEIVRSLGEGRLSSR